MAIKAALLLFRTRDGHKELLFLRPQDKPYLIFPGGKQRPDETVMQALHRELLEELGVALTGVRQIGQVAGEGIEDGQPLEVHLYSAEVIGVPRPQAPIVKLEWLDRNEAGRRQGELTSIAREEILPFIDEAKLW